VADDHQGDRHRALPVVVVSLVAAFALARATPFARARVGLDLDSFDYLGLARHESVGALLAAHRPPVYPLFLRLLGENRQIATWAQLVVGSRRGPGLGGDGPQPPDGRGPGDRLRRDSARRLVAGRRAVGP
jgi:hypothetical protein